VSPGGDGTDSASFISLFTDHSANGGDNVRPSQGIQESLQALILPQINLLHPGDYRAHETHRDHQGQSPNVNIYVRPRQSRRRLSRRLDTSRSGSGTRRRGRRRRRTVGVDQDPIDNVHDPVRHRYVRPDDLCRCVARGDVVARLVPRQREFLARVRGEGGGEADDGVHHRAVDQLPTASAQREDKGKTANVRDSLVRYVIAPCTAGSTTMRPHARPRLPAQRG
jgi:hypothetical protein